MARQTEAGPYFSFSGKFPVEIVLSFFSYLSALDLLKVSLVNKECNKLANNDRLWINLIQRTFGFKPKLNGATFREWFKKSRFDLDDLILSTLAWESEKSNIVEQYNQLSNERRIGIRTAIDTTTINQKIPVDFTIHVQAYARGFIDGFKSTVPSLLQSGKIEL
ncbi:MAG TPA: F-box-like domain-containing protein [Rhabdochlamydiaceae bacterium]|nr:F-box-like domain-containing protein [Rhabdochlamydiaceae bacterium]